MMTSMPGRLVRVLGVVLALTAAVRAEPEPCDTNLATDLLYSYDALNRVTAITLNGNPLVTYEYDGREMTRRGVRTNYAEQVGGTNPPDVYIDYEPRYDIHGRLTHIANVARNSCSSDENHLAVFSSTYDAAGNRLTDAGSQPASSDPLLAEGFAMARDVTYSYDTLHRVTKADYTFPSSVETAISYDLLGNREAVDDTLNDVSYRYRSNLANEYEEVTVGQSLTQQPNYFYDPRGNLSRDDGYDHEPDDGFLYEYDAENRLTKVSHEEDDQGTGLRTVAVYRYDALGRRIEFEDHVRGITTRYYHDGANVIAEADEIGVLQRTFVHGTQYIDERVVMRTCDQAADHPEEHYYLLKDLYTVTGLAAANGALAEAYVYDTYGQATIWAWPPADVNRDGVVDGDDYDEVFGVLFSTCAPWADVNMDGEVDTADVNEVSAANGQEAVRVTYSPLDNPFLFTGRLTDTLDARALPVDPPCDPQQSGCDEGVDYEPHFRRLQDNRNRTYDPKHGRWLQRDPIGYVDGMSLYEYVRSSPLIYVDPQGLACCTAYVRLSDAFKIPGISLIGGGHTAIELERDCESTLIELAAYGDPGHGVDNRVGYGPLGPTMYIYYALLAQSYGLTNRDDLAQMNDLSEKYFGHPAVWVIDMLDVMGQATVGAGPRHFYGLFVSPNVSGRGKKIQIALPKGQECAALDKMIEAAKDIGRYSTEEAQMILHLKVRDKQMNLPLLGDVIINADLTVGLWVGLGYDLVGRNSNSFVGSVLRQAGVQVPSEVSSQRGIGNDFTVWRPWDLAYQKLFQDAVDRALQ